MIKGEVRVEVYEVDGRDVIEERGDAQTIAFRPHLRSEESDFGGDSENFCTMEIEGTSYTVCIDEVLSALGAIQLIAKAA